MTLAQQIEQAHRSNEAKIAARIAAPRLEVDDEGKRLLGRFISFCKENGTRYLPSVPGTVAGFIKAEYTAGATPEVILKTLEAIEILHSQANAANPVACPAPRAALSEILKLDGPRSWSKSERLLIAAVPIEVRAIVERRTKQDSDLIRRLQNENYQLRKSLNSNQKDIDSNVRQEES